VALDDPDFEGFITDAVSVRRFKVSKSEVFSEKAQERVNFRIFCCTEMEDDLTVQFMQ
jgi:hypothetical protein